jgi:2-polyprenyl-6-methoxyphenol hydroxylase-like FAD-dependent oxidoreductase
MDNAMPVKTEVLIVGAGPSGLVLANVLARSGVDFRIVDAKPGPVAQSRAALIHVRTLELLDRLGLAGRAVERGVKTTRVEIYERGRCSAQVPLVGQGAEGHTPFPYALTLEQDRTEQLLIEGLGAHGRGVEWETRFVSLAQDEDGTCAVVRRPDGVHETISARWLVGADGASSSVRHALGLGFSGRTYQQTGFLADVELDMSAGASPAPGALRLNLTRGGFVGMGQLSSGLYRLFGAVPPGFAARSPGDDEISHEPYAHVGLAAIQRWFDEYFHVRAKLDHVAWSSLFHLHTRIAHRFRVANVLLVGDAAHIHSPAGGQGMNLGIGDAFNLGWKLALVTRGEALERLLDSYEAERFPVATAVLRGSDRGFALEATSNPLAVWARATLVPRLVGPLLRLPVVRKQVFRLFSQTWISYRGSPAVAGDGRATAGPRPGDRAPYGPSSPPRHSVPTRTFDLIGGTGHHLLLFEGHKPEPALGAKRQAIEELLGRYSVEAPIHVIATTERQLHQLWGASTARLFLIRPDGHVGFAGSPGQLAALAAYMDGLYARRPARTTPGPDGSGTTGSGTAGE